MTEGDDDVEGDEELAAAERWQLEQARETWRRHRLGQEPVVGWDAIERIFTEALKRAKRSDEEPS